MQLTNRIVCVLCISIIITSSILWFSLSKSGFKSLFKEEIKQSLNTKTETPYDSAVYESLINKKKPIITVDNQKLKVKTQYQVKDFIKAAVDEDGNDLMDKVMVKGTNIIEGNVFYTETIGTDIITYIVYDKDGIKGETSIMLISE